ncbi:MAG: tRNA pseudouridine(13) synthase TruD [Planctomycetota bacterium]|nr:MAG: tRNA pseudouridine(13) synthase TruD [Planctomycetota bacterium]
MHLVPGPENFVVEEIPAYEACGEGEHLHVIMRKRDCTTARLVAALATACQVPQRDIGYAGRKDRHGITTQALTIRGGDATRLDHLSQYLPPGASAEIIAVSRHRNKLRIGHLRGNHFHLRIAGIDQPQHLQAQLDQLHTHGILNHYGPQRYGRDGRNLSRALGVVNGEIPLPRNRQQRQYLADAAQAAVFDHIVQQRHNQGLTTQAMVGDVIMLDNGACFIARDEDLEQVNRRLLAGSCSCTGPLPGAACMPAEGAAKDHEENWCQQAHFPWRSFQDKAPFHSRGDRRRITERFLVTPQLTTPDHPEAPYTLSFALGPGAYATSVLSQLGIRADERSQPHAT